MNAVLKEAVSPSRHDAKIARESGRRLSRFVKRERLTLQIPSKGRDSETIELPRSVIGLLVRILAEMAEGNAVTLMPIHGELTTQQAAAILGVSRPFLIKQIKEKKIPCRQVGTHRRVRFQDLMEFKGRMDADRAKVLGELAVQAQELNMGY